MIFHFVIRLKISNSVQGTVIAVIDFLATLLEKKSFREVIQIGIPPLVPAIMIFLQPSASQINAWEEDPDRFVEGTSSKNFVMRPSWSEIGSLEISVKNRNFRSKSKFSFKIQILVKSRNFHPKSKFPSKIEISIQNRTFGKTSKFWSKIEIFVENQIFRAKFTEVTFF